MKPVNKQKNEKANNLFYLAIVLPIFCGLGEAATTIVTALELCILLYYLKTPRFWALLPIFYVYYAQLKLLSFTFFNLYIALVAFKLLFLGKIKATKNLVWSVLILVVYAGFVFMAHEGIGDGILFLFRSVISLLALMRIKEDETVYLELKFVLVAISISAMFYGIFFQNIKGVYEETGTLIQYSGRYSGTTSDPNYMAFFYCLSFVTVIFSNFKQNILKWALAIVLFCGIALTGSITALLTYTIVLLLYVVFAKERKQRYKLLGIGIIAIGVTLFVHYMKTDLDSIPILNLYKGRLLEKVQYWLNDDLTNLTTGRTEYSRLYIEYLFQQNIFRILFGGYQLNAMGLEGAAFEEIKFAAHNTYIDVLMTCGLLGLISFVLILVVNIVNKIKRWRVDKKQERLSDVIYSIISVVFIAGLSVFPGTNYMFFLLL